jgi:hypothetical protein
LLALIKEKGLPLIKTLEEIPYIHSGYVNIITPKADDNGRSDKEIET